MRPSQLVRQPIPNVTPDDVERIVRRDFPEIAFDSVMKVLNGYESKRKRSRVLLAALKLANGNLDSLRKHIHTAGQDFRDVLAPAEYPEYLKRGFRTRDLPVKEQEGIIDADWKQYELWLHR